jgi:LigXa C-terminal domain like
MCEAQGAVADRSQWHLGAADKSVIWLRRILKKALRKLDDPSAHRAWRDENMCADMAVVALVVAKDEDLRSVLDRHVAETRDRVTRQVSV